MAAPEKYWTPRDEPVRVCVRVLVLVRVRVRVCVCFPTFRSDEILVLKKGVHCSFSHTVCNVLTLPSVQLFDSVIILYYHFHREKESGCVA